MPDTDHATFDERITEILKWLNIDQIKDAMLDSKTKSGLLFVGNSAEVLIPKTKWSAPIMLIVQNLYGICMIVKEIDDYKKMDKKHTELEKVLQDTWDFIDERKPKMEKYIDVLDQLFLDITLSQETVKNSALLDKFDAYVLQFLKLVYQCRLKLQRTQIHIKEIQDNLAGMEKLSNAEFSAVGGGMFPGLLSLLYSGNYRTFFGGLVIGGAITACLWLARSVKEEKREIILSTINVAETTIKLINDTLDISVETVKNDIEELKKKGFQVADIPEWFTSLESRLSRDSRVSIINRNKSKRHLV